VAESPDIRASDSDRERVADILRRHCGEGRLTLDELGDRLSEVYAARTLGQLHDPGGPLRELPVLAPPPPAQVVAAGHLDHTVVDHTGRAFPEHLATYLAVNAALVVIWALTGAGYFWPIWIILGWGIGVASHYAAARHHHPRRV
jgi:hypothetical protein